MMADILTVADLERAKQDDTFHAEVITGKLGGNGADIDFATHARTGQIQMTLPAMIRKYGFGKSGLEFGGGGTLNSPNLLVKYNTDNYLYRYIGTGTFPIAIPAAPDGNWEAFVATVHVHSALGDRNHVGAHDAIYSRGYPTVAAMLAEAAQLAVGVKVEWRGYYTESDGGGNWGIVKSGAHTDDGGSIFSVGANTYVEANLKGKSTYFKKFGVVGDGVEDDTAKMAICWDKCKDVHGSVDDTYRITYSLFADNDFTFDLRKGKLKLDFGGVGGSAIISKTYATANTPVSNVTIKNLIMVGNGAVGENGLGLCQAVGWTIKNVIFTDIYYHSVDLGGAKDCNIIRCKHYNTLGAAVQFDTLTELGTVFAKLANGTSSPNAFDAGGASWTVTESNTVKNNVFDTCFIGVQYHRGSLPSNHVVRNEFKYCPRGIMGDNDASISDTMIDNNTFTNNAVAVRVASYFDTLSLSNNTVKGVVDGNTQSIFAYGFEIFRNTTATPRSLKVVNNSFRRLMIPLKITNVDGVTNTNNSFYDCSNKAPGNGIGSCANEMIDVNNVIVGKNRYNSCLDCGFQVRVVSNTNTVGFKYTGDQFRTTRAPIILNNLDNYTVSGHTVSAYNTAKDAVLIKNSIRGNVGEMYIETSSLNTAGLRLDGVKRSSVSHVSVSGRTATSFIFDNCGEAGVPIETDNNHTGFAPPSVAFKATGTSNIKSMEPFIPQAKMQVNDTSVISNAQLTFSNVA